MKWYRVDFAGMVESDYICAESKESAICKAFKQFAEDILQIVEVDDNKESFPDVAVVWG